jgi:HemY protein
MIRWLFFIACIAALYYGGAWLLDHPGEVVVQWLGLEITLHIVALAAVLVLFSIVIGYLSVLLWRLGTWPARRRARKQQRTLKRGLEQLTRGVTALAMGDEKLAEDALKKATLALPNEPLPQLLTAQLMQRQGKHMDAQIQFKALMQHPSTAGLATRKLIEQHLQRREWANAMTLTQEARKTSPRDNWLTLTLLDLCAREKDATQMLALTEGWQWQSPLTKEERHRYAAIGHYLLAQQVENPRKKEQALRHAVGYAPDFLPAVVEYAQELLTQESPRRARKWLLEAWKKSPSSLLIAPILECLEHESPRAQARLLKPFMAKKMEAAHYHLAARHAMHAQEFARARAELEQAIALEETKETILLMAEIESELRSNQAANSWTARAVDAPTGTTWVCMHCGHLHATWKSHCDSCDHFDSLCYERPEARITSVEVATI